MSIYLQDGIVDHASQLARQGMECSVPRSADQYTVWLIDLGHREGRFLRENG